MHCTLYNEMGQHVRHKGQISVGDYVSNNPEACINRPMEVTYINDKKNRGEASSYTGCVALIFDEESGWFYVIY